MCVNLTTNPINMQGQCQGVSPWYLKGDRWHMTHNTWPVTCDTWHITICCSCIFALSFSFYRCYYPRTSSVCRIFFIFFKASALWADAFYRSICPSVCLSVCFFVRVLLVLLSIDALVLYCMQICFTIRYYLISLPTFIFQYYPNDSHIRPYPLATLKCSHA